MTFCRVEGSLEAELCPASGHQLEFRAWKGQTAFPLHTIAASWKNHRCNCCQPSLYFDTPQGQGERLGLIPPRVHLEAESDTRGKLWLVEMTFSPSSEEIWGQLCHSLGSSALGAGVAAWMPPSSPWSALHVVLLLSPGNCQRRMQIFKNTLRKKWRRRRSSAGLTRSCSGSCRREMPWAPSSSHPHHPLLSIAAHQGTPLQQKSEPWGDEQAAVCRRFPAFYAFLVCKLLPSKEVLPSTGAQGSSLQACSVAA